MIFINESIYKKNKSNKIIKMYKPVILSSCLFGSFYLFSISLALTNRALLEDKKIPNELLVINGLTMLLSGSMIIYNYGLSNSCYFKSSRV